MRYLVFGCVALGLVGCASSDTGTSAGAGGAPGAGGGALGETDYLRRR